MFSPSNQAYLENYAYPWDPASAIGVESYLLEESLVAVDIPAVEIAPLPRVIPSDSEIFETDCWNALKLTVKQRQFILLIAQGLSFPDTLKVVYLKPSERMAAFILGNLCIGGKEFKETGGRRIRVRTNQQDLAAVNLYRAEFLSDDWEVQLEPSNSE